MKRQSAVGALALAALAAASLQAQTNRPPKLMLDLTDGSRIIGAPAVSAFPVRTAYASLDLPLAQIRKVQVESDHERATLQLANGDRLSGVLNLGPIEVQTVFGKAAIRLDLVRAITVWADRGSRLPPGCDAAPALICSFDSEEGAPPGDEPALKVRESARGPKWTREGKTGGAYDFDGRSTCLVTPVLKATGDFTWSVWIRPRSFPAQSNTFGQFLGARGHAWAWNSDNTSLSFSCQSHHGQSGLALQFCVQGSPQTGACVVHVFPVRPETDRWYHVAAASGADGMRLYLDGRLVAQGRDVFGLGGECAMVVGANDNGPQRYFDGLIDEVMVLNSALTDDQIQWLYETQK